MMCTHKKKKNEVEGSSQTVLELKYLRNMAYLCCYLGSKCRASQIRGVPNEGLTLHL